MIADSADDNVRMILPPSADGVAPIVFTYTVSGLGSPSGMTFDGAITNQANLTLSTTDTDIRAGEPVDIEIDSDIDISNFVASDCTVTNGTRGALTINSATSATLRVTAGSAGTMTVAIGEDAVDPGNVAASQDFTVNAAEVDAVLDITLDATSAENGEVVNATFTFDKSVSGFTAADVDVTAAATKGALTDNGDNTFSMPITAPATGNGTIQISVAADVVTPGNNADTVSFTYAPPADAVLDITLDATSVENGEIVNATFTFDISVGGFRRNDVQLTGAPGNARGPLVDNGDNTYSMEITAPATGSGTVDITVAADRVTPGNNSDSVSFTYAPPTPTNTAPVFGETSYAFSDLAIASGTVIGTVDATDADNDTLTYSITGTDASKFNIDADGEITAAETLEYAQDYSINVVADDGTDTTTIAVTINTETVTPRAPSIAIDATTHNSIDITITAGNNGGTSVTDWEYELDGDGTWNAFGSTDLEQTISSLESDTTYSIKVRGINSEGNGVASTAQSGTTDAAPNNAPDFANTSYTFDDVGIAVNEVVGTVAATDADNDTLSYSLTGTDADKFDIDNDGEITVAEALDYGEAYSINVVADDGTDDTSVSVTINSETVSPRAPTFVVDSTTEDSATITISPGDDGGESVSDWEYELDGDGTWVSFGNTDLEQTISNLDPETAYAIKVRGINSEGDGVASAAVTATTDAATVDTPSNLTGAGVLIAGSAALGQLEVRPRGLDSDGTYLYAIGVSQRRLIRITDLDTFASEYASAQLSGNINSLAFNDGSLYYADNNNAIYRIDSPFDTSSTSTSLGNITNSGAVRSLCSDRTDLFGYDKTNSILYRIVDNGTDITATTFATVAFPTGTTGNVNALFYFEDAFYLVNNDDNNLWKLPNDLTSGSLDVTPVRVGNFTDFDVSEGNPAGAGVLGSEAYFLGDDTNALHRFLKTTPTPTNTAPAFADASYTFADVAIAVGTVIGTVAATDADNDTLTYTLTGTDEANFAIDSNGQITVAVELTNGQAYSFNVVADDGTDTTSVGVSVTAIAATPALTFGSETIDNQAWIVGTADSITLPEATGGTGAKTYSLSPALPSGKVFTASTRVLDGNPTGRFSIETFTYMATDEDSNTVTLTFTAVVTAVAITIPNIPNQMWTVGTAVSLTLPQASGGVGAFTYSLSPTLPAGVSRTVRAVTGNPTTAVVIATYTYTAEDSEGITQTGTFTIVVAAAAVALSFGSETIGDQSWVVGTDVSLALPEATGGSGTIVYSLSPTAPAGVTFTAAIPDLDGNPTATFASTTFTYTATDDDGNGDSVELAFTIIVVAAIVIVQTTSTEATYNAAMGYNVLPESLGALKKVNASGNVESLGNLWYGERPYNVSLTRPLSVDGSLHVTMGYGNANEVLRYNSLASKADNFVHLVFGNKLKYILPAFQATGNVYSKIAELARMVGATVSFDGNIISVVDRRPFRAKTTRATGTGTGNLDVESENKAFPSSGYLRIGNEFIGYTGISSGAFTGITRGALGSEPANHSDNAGVLFVNALFSEREILQINPSTDTTRHHNIIRDSENAFEVKDDANIAQYRKQPYTLDLGLTRNEDAWIETIFAEYLSELKTLGSVFDVRLRPRKKSFALDLGQFIGLRHDSVAYVLRIEMIDYHSKRVDIFGVP